MNYLWYISTLLIGIFMSNKAFLIVLALMSFAALSASVLGMDEQTTSREKCITTSQEDLKLKDAHAVGGAHNLDTHVHHQRG
jgi:hypothetical protein